MGPEGQDQDQGSKRRANEQPGAVSAPSAMRFITQAADHRVIDGISEPGK